MLLNKVRIYNYRTISEHVLFDVRNLCAFIGPNNTGKTNILSATHLFFSCHFSSILNNRIYYDRDRDFPPFVENGNTTIQVFCACEESPPDEAILELYRDIKRVLKILEREAGRGITIHLTLSRSGAASYQLFPNAKKPSGLDEQVSLNTLVDQFLEMFFSSFAVHYIQSDKRFEEIYRDLLLPAIKEEISHGLDDSFNAIKRKIDQLNIDINELFSGAGISDITVRLTAPDRFSELIGNIYMRLDDKILSEMDTKGMGVQSLAMTSCMLWLQKYYHKRDQSVIWLIEEPESFMHPTLIASQKRVMYNLGVNSNVLYTTHSLGVLPQNASEVIGVDKVDMQTSISFFRNRFEATRLIRRGLGLNFSDFYDLDSMTVAVEGPTDKMYVEWFLDLYKGDGIEDRHSWPLLRSSNIVDYGGVQPLQHFIQSSYEFIRHEVVFVALFDSDEAGVKARSALQSVFKNYASGLDFVSLRTGYAIEGLFSDKIIKDVQATHPGLLVRFSIDAQGTVEPFGQL